MRDSNIPRGFSLVEVLVGVSIFLVVSIAIYQGYIQVFNLVRSSRHKSTAVLLANEQFEIMRNLPYSQVGEPNGIPVGIVPHVQTFVRDQATYIATTTIRNAEDPFDGTSTTTPIDTSPADYKIAEIEITCMTCQNPQAVILSGRIAPKNLETSSTNGALFVKVFDANGLPVSDASVHIENNTINPKIVIDDVTNVNGMLQIVDVPPGTDAYEITVTKSGYSTDKTYPRGGSTPNPIKPHATVLLQQVTQVSFAIDLVSTMSVTSVTDTCSPVGSASFTLSGSKIISSPATLKYDQNFVTSGGLKTISNLEWDSYTISLGDATYDLKGIIPLLPISLAPNASQSVKFILANKNPKSLLVSIKDGGSGLPITGATVALSGGAGADMLMTGQGYFRQTDWSGGSGQSNFSNITQYASSDGNVDTTSTVGSLKLKNTFGAYSTDGSLTSSSFDTGTSSNFYQILWQPASQPSQAGSNAVRIQLASNSDNATWNFIGPDGTAGTYYTLSNLNVGASINGNRYLRYKIFLHTDDTAYTPTVSDISITYSSECTPPGQVFFTGLSSGTYTIQVDKSGYQSFSGPVPISSSWSSYDVNLIP